MAPRKFSAGRMGRPPRAGRSRLARRCRCMTFGRLGLRAQRLTSYPHLSKQETPNFKVGFAGPSRLTPRKRSKSFAHASSKTDGRYRPRNAPGRCAVRRRSYAALDSPRNVIRKPDIRCRLASPTRWRGRSSSTRLGSRCAKSRRSPASRNPRSTIACAARDAERSPGDNGPHPNATSHPHGTFGRAAR